MSVPEEIRKLTEEVVASFDSGVGAVGQLIDKGLELLDGYRREEEAVRSKLRESLASVGSLRRKDFDGIMERILSFQSGREAEIKSLIRNFLSGERALTERLRRSLGAGLFPEVDRLKGELNRMIEKARVEIQSFQQEQERIRQVFSGLEGRRDQVTSRELKKAIDKLEADLFVTTEETLAAIGR